MDMHWWVISCQRCHLKLKFFFFHPSFHCVLIRMAVTPSSGSSSIDVDMRASSKRGFLDVESDPGLLSSLSEQLNKTVGDCE